MNLSERFKTIIQENGLKQKELAKELGVTESYISALISGRNKAVSPALAALIEEKYGYNAHWVLNDDEPKRKVSSKNKNLSDLHKKAIFHIEQMSQEQIRAVLAFVASLEEIEEALKD